MSCVAALGCAQVQQSPKDAIGRLYSIDGVSAELAGVTLVPRGAEVSMPPFDAATWRSDSYKNRLKIEFGNDGGVQHVLSAKGKKFHRVPPEGYIFIIIADFRPKRKMKRKMKKTKKRC